MRARRCRAVPGSAGRGRAGGEGQRGASPGRRGCGTAQLGVVRAGTARHGAACLPPRRGREEGRGRDPAVLRGAQCGPGSAASARHGLKLSRNKAARMCVTPDVNMGPGSPLARSARL